jgi:hypothetical protein
MSSLFGREGDRITQGPQILLHDVARGRALVVSIGDEELAISCDRHARRVMQCAESQPAWMADRLLKLSRDGGPRRSAPQACATRGAGALVIAPSRPPYRR